MNELIRLVQLGDYGDRMPCDMHLLEWKIRRDQDLYVQGEFSWEYAVETNAPALVFCDACADILSYRSLPALPLTTDHIKKDLNIVSTVPEYVKEQAATLIGNGGKEFDDDQCVVVLPGYRSKIQLNRTLANVSPDEVWIQRGNRITPMHVDHGRTLAYILPCMIQTFKVWVFFSRMEDATMRIRNSEDSMKRMLENPLSRVIIQRPGDIVYLNCLVYHAVMLVYQPGTSVEDKWGIIGGPVIVLARDRHNALRYATEACTAASKGSNAPWSRVLPAFVAMEGRKWSNAALETEKQRFRAQIKDTSYVKSSASALVRYQKREKRKDRLRQAREAKKARPEAFETSKGGKKGNKYIIREL